MFFLVSLGMVGYGFLGNRSAHDHTPPPSQSQTHAIPGWITIKTSHPPTQIMLDGNPIQETQEAVFSIVDDHMIAVLQVEWPEEIPSPAAEIIFEPDGMTEKRNTFWGSGEHVWEITWP